MSKARTYAQAARIKEVLALAEEDLKHLNGILRCKHNYEFWKGKKNKPATNGRKWMKPKCLDRNLVELERSMVRTVLLLRLSCDSMGDENGKTTG